MNKVKYLLLVLLAVSAASPIWADSYPVQWSGETNVTYNGQPQNVLSAIYVDANNNSQNLVLTFTNGTEVLSTPNYPVNAGAWTVTASSTLPGVELTGNTMMLNIQPATVYVTGASAEVAKFADGELSGVVTDNGTLNGVMGNDDISHLTTAIFSDANVGTGKTITLHYALLGNATMLSNYVLTPSSDFFTNSGVVIPNMVPDLNLPGDENTQPQNGMEINAHGYCTGSGYSINYHLVSGNPDEYSIDFADTRMTDVNWTALPTSGANGTLNVNFPIDLPTGDYSMNVYFRDSRFPALVSNPVAVNLHVNLSETYTVVLFSDVIALVDTCNCFTDIQWYHRANASAAWQAIDGANGYYYREEGGLTGEYFVKAKMNGVETYTCPQSDLETLYKEAEQPASVSVYPNPTSENLQVKVEGSQTATHILRVVNTMGVEVENSTFEGGNTTVNMCGYPKGNYMVSVDGIVVRVIRN